MKKPARTWVPVVTLGPLLAIVIAVAFIQSFGALTQIGEVNAWRPAWLLPVLVDVGMLGTNIGSALFRARDLPGSWLANSMFGFFALVSVWANISHALAAADFTHTSVWEAAGFATLAPFAQLGLTHMLMWMFPNEKDRAKLASSRATRAAKRAHKEAKLGLPTVAVPSVGVEVVPEIPRPARPVPVEQPSTTGRIVQPAPRPAVTAVSASRVEVVDRVLAYWLEHGKKPTGELVGEWMGKSKKTGQRLVKELELSGAFDIDTSNRDHNTEPEAGPFKFDLQEASRA